MTATALGPTTWSMNRDEEGYRVYKITHLVECDDQDDGPATVMSASGLPAIGAAWSYGNDSDSWALCLPTMEVKTYKKGRGPGLYWEVTNTFTNKPLKRCQTTSIDNPILEPAKLSGTFIKTVREAFVDCNGAAILSSSLEPIRGPAVERDYNKPTVDISFNVLTHPLSTYAPMIDTVNNATLWGLPARTVKLDNVAWEKRYYGVCTAYYNLKYSFSIDYNTFDTTALDEGTRVLKTGGDANDPRDFERAKDTNDENIRVVLDGAGNAVGTGTPGTVSICKYSSSNLLLLGIPSSL